MAQPNVNSVHVDAILTNISIAYLQNQSNFIASQVFPTVPVDKASDLYYKYRKNDWFRDEAQRRADATESAGSGYNLDQDSYNTQGWAFHKDIGDQTAANADAPLNLEADATAFVSQRLAIRREIDFVSKYFVTSVWAADITGVVSAPSGIQTIQWSTATGSDPISDIDLGKDTILQNTGFEPNTLVVGYKVWRVLKKHALVVDRYKYTSSASITTAMVAELFEIDRILVAKAVKATNNEGATEAYAFTHGNNALLCYSAPNPGLLVPSAGYCFSWTGVSKGLGATTAVKTFYMQELSAQRVEAEQASDQKVVATDLGYFFSGIVQ